MATRAETGSTGGDFPLRILAKVAKTVICCAAARIAKKQRYE
jgi:hypothetical protein